MHRCIARSLRCAYDRSKVSGSGGCINQSSKPKLNLNYSSGARRGAAAVTPRCIFGSSCRHETRIAVRCHRKRNASAGIAFRSCRRSAAAAIATLEGLPERNRQQTPPTSPPLMMIMEATARYFVANSLPYRKWKCKWVNNVSANVPSNGE